MHSRLAYDFAGKITPMLWPKPHYFIHYVNLLIRTWLNLRDPYLATHKQALKKESINISGSILWVPRAMVWSQFPQWEDKGGWGCAQAASLFTRQIFSHLGKANSLGVQWGVGVWPYSVLLDPCPIPPHPHPTLSHDSFRNMLVFMRAKLWADDICS